MVKAPVPVRHGDILMHQSEEVFILHQEVAVPVKKMADAGVRALSQGLEGGPVSVE